MAELPLTMPKMSMTMEEGTMVSWLKNVGDPVRSGEPICEVATDKVDMEVESPFDGTLARIVAEPDEVLKVGATIAFITTDADDLLGGLFDAPDVESSDVARSDAPAPDSSAPAGVGGDWIAAVPLARSMAAERQLDLATVTPTGPGNTVRVVDVEHATAAIPAAHELPVQPSEAAVLADSAPAVPGLSEESGRSDEPIVPPSTPTEPDAQTARRRRTRMQVAKVMTASAAVPQFTAFSDVDLWVTAAARSESLGGASWNAILLRAQAMALAEHPILTSFWGESGAEPQDHIGVAMAVDSPTGLVAPVIIDPHVTPLIELVAHLADLVAATRSGKVDIDRLTGATTVFSNLGGFGVHSFTALLTPPHATALSVGAVTNSVLVREDGAIAFRPVVRVGLTVDHRVADGADAARFLSTFASILASPERLA